MHLLSVTLRMAPREIGPAEEIDIDPDSAFSNTKIDGHSTSWRESAEREIARAWFKPRCASVSFLSLPVFFHLGGN